MQVMQMTAEETLARWEADETALRSRPNSSIGVATREQVAGRTGMEVLAGIASGELPRAPISDTLDFLLVHVEPGFAVFQGRPGRRHYNPLGSVHGGWFATLLDSCVGCAVHSSLPAAMHEPAFGTHERYGVGERSHDVQLQLQRRVALAGRQAGVHRAADA